MNLIRKINLPKKKKKNIQEKLEAVSQSQYNFMNSGNSKRVSISEKRSAQYLRLKNRVKRIKSKGKNPRNLCSVYIQAGTQKKAGRNKIWKDNGLKFSKIDEKHQANHTLASYSKAAETKDQKTLKQKATGS